MGLPCHSYVGIISQARFAYNREVRFLPCFLIGATFELIASFSHTYRSLQQTSVTITSLVPRESQTRPYEFYYREYGVKRRDNIS